MLKRNSPEFTETIYYLQLYYTQYIVFSTWIALWIVPTISEALRSLGWIIHVTPYKAFLFVHFAVD